MESQNETKAKEIAIQRKKHYFDADALIINSEVECYASAIDMAKWKDEQFEKEKQQLIDGAVEWLNKYLFYLDKKDDIINNFKQALKGV